MTSKAVLLVGSPRGEKSTSSSLGAYMMTRLEGKGWGCVRHYVGSTVQSISDFEKVFADVEEAQLVVLAAPLYVDSLPAPVIQFMELYGVRGSIRNTNGPRLCLIVNCGFPEDQNMLAVEIARHFAAANGMEWCGSLSMGQGGVIWGKGLEEVGEGRDGSVPPWTSRSTHWSKEKASQRGPASPSPREWYQCSFTDLSRIRAGSRLGREIRQGT